MCPRCGYRGPEAPPTPANYYSSPATMYNTSPSPAAPPSPAQRGPVAAPGYGQPAPGWAPAAPGGMGMPGMAPAAVYLPRGKPRSFGISLLLVIVTLSIYGYVWAYKVFKEVTAQAGLKHQQGLFWAAIGLQVANVLFSRFTYEVLGLAADVCLLVYFVLSIRQLNEARAKIGLPLGMNPNLFAVLVGIALVGVAAVAFVFSAQVAQLGLVPNQPPTDQQLSQMLAAVGWLMLAVLVGSALQIVAYYQLSKSVNQYWYPVYQQSGQPWPNVGPI